MSENPYQTPTSNVESEAQLSEFEKNNLKKLATGQKLVIYAVLLYFMAVAARQFFPPLTLLLALICLVMSLVGVIKIVSVLKIHIFFKVLYFILLFVPLINILALLSLNSRATKMLKDGGYSVGFMGAKLKNA